MKIYYGNTCLVGGHVFWEACIRGEISYERLCLAGGHILQ